MHVVHYINQFFGGVGGEAAAERPPEVRQGPVGPGVLLDRALAPTAAVAATVICGDGFCVEHPAEVAAVVQGELRRWRDAVLVAGPAFTAGRYGMACMCACRAAEEAGCLAVTSQAPENPVMDGERGTAFVFTAMAPTEMEAVLEAIAAFLRRRAAGAAIGPASEEGYVPRRIRRNIRLGRGAGERAVEMLLRKIRREQYVSEIPLPREREAVPPPPAVESLTDARIALVTESGLVPTGNPDGLPSVRASRWFRYSLEGLKSLRAGDYSVIHGGYDSAAVNQDPNRAVPVDAFRRQEEDGTIGQLYPWYLATCGNGGTVSVMEAMGREMAAELVVAGVSGVILTAT